MDKRKSRTWTQWLPLGLYWALLFAVSITHHGAASDDLLMPLLILAGLPFFIVAARALSQPAIAAEEEHLAYTDELTSLANRRAFFQDAQLALHHAKPGSVGLILLDVDGLKRLNDECGHQAGDELLASVAFHLSGKGGKLYRIGGDEFAILIERANGESVTSVVHETQPYMAKFATCGHRHEVRMSYGTTSNQSGEGFEPLFQRADERLRYSKRQLYSKGLRSDRRAIIERQLPDPTSSSNDDPGRPHLRLLG